jgi:periplasmic protein TonB
MPRDLFGDVQRPAVRVGSSARYTVPLSLAAHVAAILAVVGGTLLGPVVLPGLASSDLVYHTIVLPPTPPPPAPRPPTSEPPPAPLNPNAAPTVAPEGIAPEPEVPFDPGPATDLGSGFVPGITNLDTIVGEPPPSAPAVPLAPVRPGPKVRPPVKVRDAAPIYPAIAQQAHVSGTVIIEATIDVDGRVRSVRVLRSIPLLDEAALDAVRQWEYTPTLLNGTPVAVIMTVTVTFQLR